MATADGRIAHLVDRRTARTIGVMGPTVQYLTPPKAGDGEPCLLRGTIPPGVVVPLHSHADPETFVMISGRVEGLVMRPDGHEWVAVGAGDVFHVPGHAKHAWRNLAAETAVMNMVTTGKMGRFFMELGVPAEEGSASGWPPSEADVQRFLEVAERFGYWNATPEENAEVGLRLG
jgi:mannose-6-phosphate isomerase-like protein (cupin superfamily)